MPASFALGMLFRSLRLLILMIWQLRSAHIKEHYNKSGCVIKADGLAAGKGVVVADNEGRGSCCYVEEMLGKGKFGSRLALTSSLKSESLALRLRFLPWLTALTLSFWGALKITSGRMMAIRATTRAGWERSRLLLRFKRGTARASLARDSFASGKRHGRRGATL